MDTAREEEEQPGGVRRRPQTRGREVNGTRERLSGAHCPVDNDERKKKPNGAEKVVAGGEDEISGGGARWNFVEERSVFGREKAQLQLITLADPFPFTVFCLQHRSYNLHQCPNAGKNDVNVVICPLCAKGVRLDPDQDPNITWEYHVNTNCDPSNYERATKKKKCPVPGCRELLTFSNTIKCRDCTIDHCLKHRFGPDHKCLGPPKKLDSSFPFLSMFNNSSSRKEESKTSRTTSSKTAAASSNRWTTSFLNAASSFKASAEAGISKLSNDFSQAVQVQGGSSNGGGASETCPQCRAKFSSVTALVEHVQKVHERNGSRAGGKKVTIDACPKCSKGFVDPVSLVEHVEKEHGGTSKSNVMQYNSPSTVFFRKARAIQELAKKDFDNLRQKGEDGEPQPRVIRRGRPPRTIEKSPEQPSTQLPNSESPNAAPGPVSDNSKTYNLRKGLSSNKFITDEAMLMGTDDPSCNGTSLGLQEWNTEFPAYVCFLEWLYNNQQAKVVVLFTCERV
ncbi:unnamed protein product [Rhodiola kirilowii]